MEDISTKLINELLTDVVRFRASGKTYLLQEATKSPDSDVSSFAIYYIK